MSDLVVQNNSSGLNLFDIDQFMAAQKVSKLFAASDLVPDIYKVSEKNPESKAIANCFIAINKAHQMGLDPLTVMQNLNIVMGRPCWGSSFLIATVNSSGRFKPLKYRFTSEGKVGKINITEFVWDSNAKKKLPKTIVFDGTNIDNLVCIAYTSSIDDPDEILESTPVSISMAILEGWYTKAGSKWPIMPKQMLMYRSASFWTNTYAPEISKGMKTTEEVRDIVDVDYTEVKQSVEDEINEKANSVTLTMPVVEKTKQPEPEKKEPVKVAETKAAESEKAKPKQVVMDGAGF